MVGIFGSCSPAQMRQGKMVATYINDDTLCLRMYVIRATLHILSCTFHEPKPQRCTHFHLVVFYISLLACVLDRHNKIARQCPKSNQYIRTSGLLSEEDTCEEHFRQCELIRVEVKVTLA
jgi:hypothetical protein